MFVKNANSIKRQTISVDDKLKTYLINNGYSPVSKKNDEWIYIQSESILNLLKNHKGSDG